ncbi:MAG: ABC transporter permease [Longimicrobiales bacterium]|nr:ABC transporter permease [Longimicrobiales bacterium]
MSDQPGHFPGASVIAWASRLVPRVRRAAWRREWEAESAYAWQRMHGSGEPNRLQVLRLRMRILTCVIDALWEKKETMTMTGLSNDVRHAVRGLVRYPTFAAIAVLTLALGIGANTAVFTLVDGVLLSPLPFDDADELVAIRHQGREGADQLPMSTGLYGLYRDQATTIEDVALYRSTVVNLVSEGDPQRVPVQVVTPGFFELLGATPVTGRTFIDAEGTLEGERVAILSDGFWESRFGRDPSVLGQSLDVDGRPTTIVGVMPADFGLPDRDARFWMPFRIDPNRAPLAAFGAAGVARLSDGVTLEGLDAELNGLVARLGEHFPEDGSVEFLQSVGLAPIVIPLQQEVVGDVSRTLWILLGTVGLVLLIACANVANLLLVRAEGRQRELALRVAVGAGRTQVLRTFMSESIVLATAGSALGVLIANGALRLTLANVPADIPRVAEIGMDLRVLSFTLVVAVACALFFGLFPLVRYGADDIGTQLRDGAAHGATGRRKNRLRNGLVMTQMALALVLLIGSGLMFRSFQALRAVDPGFDSEGIVTARVSVPTSEIESWEETEAFFRALQDRLAA